MNRLAILPILLIWPLTSSGGDAKPLDAAQALFKQRCTSAGERIDKTVKDVDGVFLLKLRSSTINYSNQFRLDDPYGSDYLGEGYIKSFLQAHHELPAIAARMKGYAFTPREQFGYAFVEADNPSDGKRHRYTAIIEQPGLADPQYIKDYVRVVMTSHPSNDQPPRYGVTYEDISTTEDRQHWIAGSSLKVVDLQTNEVIAERIGYMMDPGQGRRGSGGGRSPWLIAAHTACPAFKGPNPNAPQGGQTAIFVEKVLQPRAKPQSSSTQ